MHCLLQWRDEYGLMPELRRVDQQLRQHIDECDCRWIVDHNCPKVFRLVCMAIGTPQRIPLSPNQPPSIDIMIEPKISPEYDRYLAVALAIAHDDPLWSLAAKIMNVQ